MQSLQLPAPEATLQWYIVQYFTACPYTHFEHLSCSAPEASMPQVRLLLCATVVWHKGLAVAVAVAGTAGALVGCIQGQEQ